MAKVFQTHVTKLKKVQTQLAMNQKMDYTQLILSEANKAKAEKAKQLIGEAVALLNDAV
mgnify:CR=1 FL=1